MDREIVAPVAIILLAGLFSMVAAQQQVPNSNPTAASLVSCNITSTKPSPAQENFIHEKCIVAKFAPYLSLGGNNYIELKNGVVNQNSSLCNASVPTPVNPKLVIDFACSQLEIEFAENDTHIFVKSINGKYNLVNSTTPQTFSNATALFPTADKGHYYKCNAEQAVNVSPINGNNTVQLVLSHVAYEVFRSSTGSEFYKVPEECALDSSQVSDLVRAGVGISLAAIFILVFVAFFIGRRRWTERSSYESV